MIDSRIHIAFHDILKAFENYSEREAIIDKDGSTYTYSEFKTYITGARSELIKRGIKKGDKVLVFVPMSLELYSILEGLFSIGATAIFLDPWMKGKKMSQVIRQVKPDLFVVTKKINRIARILPVTWFLKKWIVEKIVPNNNAWQIDSVNDDDNALITFTSGTSGKPKGANRTFGFLHSQAETLKSHLISQNNQHYIDYTNFPIVGLADFAMGNTVVVPQINLMKIDEANTDDIILHLEKTKANRIIVSPILLKKISVGLKRVTNITEVVTGGAPISNTLLKFCVNNFPKIKFEAIYGSTEAEPICITSFDQIADSFDNPLKGVFVGKPVYAIQLKIIKPKAGSLSAFDLDKSELSETEIGEIIVTGNHVNKNYFENEEAFRINKIVDKNKTIWHRTGDIGYLENEQLYLVGRDHRIMEFENKKIYPYPIEQYIEEQFGYTDLGYVKNKNGKFILYIGEVQNIDIEKIKSEIKKVGYPVDEIIFSKKSLPRDARHKSKLQIENLI